MIFCPSFKYWVENISDKAQSVSTIFSNGIPFPLTHSFTKQSDKYVFFIPSAFDRTKLMPKFQRASYFEKLPYNCLSFFDPTHFLTDDLAFSSGWFQGTSEQFYSDHLTSIIVKIAEAKNIDPKNMLFYGTSSAGIPALQAASQLPGSNVFIGNIQTNLFNHYRSKKERVFNVCYPGLSEESIKEKFWNRLQIWDIDESINLYYAQNYHDKHYDMHYLPYLEKLKSKSHIHLNTLTYYNKKTGHGPHPASDEISTICEIFEKGDIKTSFKEYMTKDN